jgi:autoinducer 2-degrading protein
LVGGARLSLDRCRIMGTLLWAQQAAPTPEEAMYVTLVHVHVKLDRLEEFIEITRQNHEASVMEPGNLRFDVLQLVEDPTRFILYEAYRDEAAAKAHKETAHYAAWREAAPDLMAEPRTGVRYDGLFPAAAGSDI